MSVMYCTRCDRTVDTDFMDHAHFGDEFTCERCVDDLRFDTPQDKLTKEEQVLLDKIEEEMGLW